MNSGVLGILPICKCIEHVSLYSVRYFNSLTLSTMLQIPLTPLKGIVTYSKPAILPSLKGINPKRL